MNNNTKLFVVYSDFLKGGFSEKTEAHLIFSIFVFFKKSHYIDTSKFLNNYNGYFVDSVSTKEDLDTKDYYSPIPLSILKQIFKDLNITYSNDNELADSSRSNNINSRQRLKKKLVDILVNKNHTKNSLIKSLSNKELRLILNNIYKPYCPSKQMIFNDFIMHPARNNDLETFETKKDTRNNESIWLSNSTISKFLTPFVYNSEFHYIGVIHLKDIDNVQYEYMNDLYNRHKLKHKLTEAINKASLRYVAALVSSNDHWSALCFDREKQYLYYFNSNGNLPTYYSYHPNYYFYCFINHYTKNKTCHLNKTLRIYKPIEIVLDSFKAKQVFLNVNVSQLNSGFCGIFSLIFLLLNILYPIKESADIKKIYNFFRFKSDYSMSLYRKMFFSDSTDCKLIIEELNKQEHEILRLRTNINLEDSIKI